jgi:hypothetical protein
MDFNPIDKATNLLSALKEYNPSIRRKSDKGYDWLEEETDICIEVLNPDSDNPDDGLTIICEDDGEFTLCFGAHVHYSPCDDEYNQMCQTALDILNNKVCSADLLCGEDKIWLGGGLMSRYEIERPVSDVFDFFWQQEYFVEKIQSSGYEVHYCFWDRSLNKIIRAS